MTKTLMTSEKRLIPKDLRSGYIMWLFHFFDILLYYCTCTVASVTVNYVCKQQCIICCIHVELRTSI